MPLRAGNVTYSECTPCAAGTFSPVEDVSRCTPAAAGYYTTGGTGRQVACPAGTYSDVTGGASCTTCPLNRGGDTTVTSTTPGWTVQLLKLVKTLRLKAPGFNP